MYRRQYEITYRHAGVVFPQRSDKIRTASGPGRSVEAPVFAQWFHRAEAFVVGDAARIEALLKKTLHVGRVRRNGWGEVRRVEVVEDEAARSGWALRPLAPGDLASRLPDVPYALAASPTCPPYWKRPAARLMACPAV